MNLYRLTESCHAWTRSTVTESAALIRYRRGDLFRLREYAGANVVVRDRAGQVVTIPRRLLEEVPEAGDVSEVRCGRGVTSGVPPCGQCDACVTVPAGADDGDHTGGGPVG